MVRTTIDPNTRMGLDITWEVHKEQKILDMDKKLIVNVAAPGALVSPLQNPDIPQNPEQIAEEIIDAYKAGASMWHVHIREGGEYICDPEIYRKTTDLVRKEAPDIITNLCVVTTFEECGAEKRLKPLIDPLVEYGPGYCESALINCQTHAIGPVVQKNTEASIKEEAAYMVKKGVKPELVGYNQMNLVNIKEWLVDTNIVPKPYLIDVIAGIHNSTPNYPTQDGLTNYINQWKYLPALREDCVIQCIMGGRNWLPFSLVGIMLGSDIVRVGTEDCLYMYPHKDDIIGHSVNVVKKIVLMAKEMGREIATPSEARKILGLKPLK